MKIIRTVLIFFVLPFISYAQHTFSICAYDSVTGQVGSAGATCITSASTSAIIISDVHPGVGVVHTQASWLAGNQNYARQLMNLGTLTPLQIIDSVTIHDVQGNATVRQYGVVTAAPGSPSAGYTGSACLNYHNHITGPGYSIQGNILLGPQILDSMQSKFLNTPGNLACRLMAALQGAKVVGADTRCTNYGISSFSSFIRVANPTDVAGSFYLDISVNTYPDSIDPIDSLQARFDLWGGCLASYVSSSPMKAGIKIYPNPVGDKLTIGNGQLAINAILIYNVLGEKVLAVGLRTPNSLLNTELDVRALSPGIYFLKMQTNDGDFISAKVVKE